VDSNQDSAPNRLLLCKDTSSLPTLLAFYDHAVDLIHALPDLLAQRVLLEFREVVQINIHQLCRFDKLMIQRGFGVFSHGCIGAQLPLAPDKVTKQRRGERQRS